MNGPHTRAYVKDNSFTRLIDRVSQMNANEGKPAGRAASQAAEHFITAIPAGRVRSLKPAEAARLDFVPPPLSPDEVMAANAQAAALGIVDNDELPMPNMGDGPTDTTGGPSEEEIEQMLPARFRAGPSPAAGPAVVPSGVPLAPEAARTILNSRAMPNFRNIQGFNLVTGVAIVDGVEFPLTETDVRDMKKFALHVVLDSMVIQVAQALIDIGVPEEMAAKAAQSLRETAANAAVPGSMSNGGAEPPKALPVVSKNKTINGVSPSPESMQILSEDGRQETDVEWLLADREEEEAEQSVQADEGGSSDGTEM